MPSLAGFYQDRDNLILPEVIFRQVYREMSGQGGIVKMNIWSDGENKPGNSGERWARPGGGVVAITLILGVLADLTGLALCTVSYIRFADDGGRLNTIGTWLLVAGLVFFFTSAHFLDRMETRP